MIVPVIIPAAVEVFCRAYVRGSDCVLLAGVGNAAPLRTGDRLVGPPVFLRKGFRMVSSPAVFFPQMVTSDYGAPLDAVVAVDWIARSGIGHPRAEAHGVLDDGSDAVCVLRELDLSEPCLLYASSEAGEFPGSLVLADCGGLIGSKYIEDGNLFLDTYLVREGAQVKFGDVFENILGK